MNKLNVKDQIFNEMKLPELFAQALSKNFDIPYEEAIKYSQNKFNEKIDEVNKTMYVIGNKDLSEVKPNNEMSINDFTQGKKIIKG